MKRAGNLLSRVADPDNLRLAFWKASKGKRYSRSVLLYQEYLDDHLLALREDILTGKVTVGAYTYFTVFDPKERKICASAFREQVLHHALMNVCHSFFEKVQIYHSYACRKGKGTYAALAQAKNNCRLYPWYLKLDVKKFFDSIHHEVLKDQLARRFKDYPLLSIMSKIIDSYSTSHCRGLPIGNLTSQYFANHYLSELDHYIHEKLKIRAYVRYMDDMVLWGEDKKTLSLVLVAIRSFVETKLLCELKPETLNSCSQGLTFLGYRLFPYHILLSRLSKRRFVKKMKKIHLYHQCGIWSEAICKQRAEALIAFTLYARSKNFRKMVLDRLSL